MIATPRRFDSQGNEVGLDHDAVVALEDKNKVYETDAAKTAANVAAGAATEATRLAAEATAKAAVLAAENQSAAVKIAVSTALREQHVDHVLEEHGAHLATINGSVADLAKEVAEANVTLVRMEGNLATSEQVAAALRGRRLTRHQIIFATIAAIFSFVSLVVGILAATGGL